MVINTGIINTGEAKAANIVHEAEVQRQHMRLQMPIKIELGGNVYEVADWSHQGLALYAKPLQAHNVKLEQGAMLSLKLLYDFNGFSLVMPMKCEVRHLSADGSKAGCRFHDLNERNASLLQYLISAYVAGDMVHVGDVLDVAARKNFTNARKMPALAAKKSARKFFNVVCLLLLGFALAGYCFMGIYERVYVVQASSAAIVPNLDTGGAIIEAVIPYEGAMKIAKNMQAKISIPAHDFAGVGKVTEIIMNNASVGEVLIYVAPAKPLPNDWVRLPVSLKIDTR